MSKDTDEHNSGETPFAPAKGSPDTESPTPDEPPPGNSLPEKPKEKRPLKKRRQSKKPEKSEFELASKDIQRILLDGIVVAVVLTVDFLLHLLLEIFRRGGPEWLLFDRFPVRWLLDISAGAIILTLLIQMIRTIHGGRK